jgi:hypothetical protein
MLSHPNALINLRCNNTPVHLADQSTVEANKKGLLTLLLSVKSDVKVLVVLSLHEPLLSVASLCDNNLCVVFSKNGVRLKSAS